MSEEVRHKFSRLTFYTLLLAFLGVTMTFVIFSSVAQVTLTCTINQFVFQIGTNNDACASPSTNTGPITFIQTIFQNSSSTDSNQFLTTPSWTSSQNESMLVIASSENTFARGVVTSVTDTLGDAFSLIIREHVPGMNEPTDLEVWYGKDSPSKTNAVTVTWNITNNSNGNMIQVELYQNVASIGQSTGQAAAAPLPPTILTVTTAHNGDWMLGAIATISIPGSPMTTPCPGQVSAESPGFVTRSKGCSTPGATDGVETWASDNATSIRNGITITYAPTLLVTASTLAQVEIEMIPVDLEPIVQNVDLTTLCPTVGQTCHINFANRVSGGNSLQTLAPNTAYCTGITTSALTVSQTQSMLEVSATYSAVDTNVTSLVANSPPKLLIQVYTSTNAPTTTFGAGLCASGGIVVGPGTIIFATSGTNGQYNVNYYSTSINGESISNIATGTYYAWIEITPQNFPAGAGHMAMAQWGLAPNSQLTLKQLH